MNNVNKVAARKLRSMATAIRAESYAPHEFGIREAMETEAVELERRADILAPLPKATVDAWPVGTYATIKVTDGAATAWPVVKRLIGGWQSGAHHYPDSTVESVRVLEVGGQQPGVPVEKVQELLSYCHVQAKDGDATEDEQLAYDDVAIRLSALLPKEPTS